MRMRTALMGTAGVLLSHVAIAAPSVQNPTFDVTNYAWPGYEAGTLSGLPSWYPPQTTDVPKWNVTAGGGGTPFRTDGFWDNGAVGNNGYGYQGQSGSVAFIQGSGGTISQSIGGLTAGQTYTVSFFANGRAATYGSTVPGFSATMDATPLYVSQAVTPVGGTNQFNYYSARFVATGSSETLTFTGRPIGTGDSAVTIGAVNVSDKLIQNPNFNPSNYTWPGYSPPVGTTIVSGWTASPGAGASPVGNGGFWDNGYVTGGQGKNGFVGFTQGQSSLTQEIIAPAGNYGGKYRLTFQANGRAYKNGATPSFEVLVDGTLVGGTLVGGTPVFGPTPIAASGGAGDFSNPFQNFTVDFTDLSPTFTLSFVGLANGDASELYADVNLVGLPEPATLALVGAGLLGVGLVRRRKAG